MSGAQKRKESGSDRPLAHVSKLCMREDLSDLTIVTKSRDGLSRRFPVHKVVLGACSPYWKALLYGNFKEANEKEVTLIDVDGDVFESVLRFAYQGVLELNGIGISAMLYAALLFQMSTLLAACVDYVEENKTVDLCCDVLSIESNENPFGSLQKDCKVCLLQQCKALLSKESLLKAMSQATLVSLLQTQGLNIDELEVFTLVQAWCAAHAKNKTDRKELRRLYAPFEQLVRYGLIDKSQLRSIVRNSGLVSEATLLDVWEMLCHVQCEQHLLWVTPRNGLVWQVPWDRVRSGQEYKTTSMKFDQHYYCLRLYPFSSKYMQNRLAVNLELGIRPKCAAGHELKVNFFISLLTQVDSEGDIRFGECEHFYADCRPKDYSCCVEKNLLESSDTKKSSYVRKGKFKLQITFLEIKVVKQ